MAKEIRKEYRTYLRLEKSLSANSVEAYEQDLDKLFAFFDKYGIDPQKATFNDLQAFVYEQFDAKTNARTQSRILSGIRSFYHFLLTDGYIDSDPTELLESPQLGAHLPEVLSTEEVDSIEAAIDLSKWEGHRNRAIIETLFSCGLRVSELVNLRMSNLYLEERFLRVMGKGSKERLVPMSPRVITELGYWFEYRQAMDIKAGEEDYVFLNRRGAHLTRTMILIMVKRLATEAGIKKTISPHTFRHSFATALLEGGADLRAIQAMLGHESITTTEIYTHIDTATLRREIEEHHPRNILSHHSPTNPSK